MLDELEESYFAGDYEWLHEQVRASARQCAPVRASARQWADGRVSRYWEHLSDRTRRDGLFFIDLNPL